MCESANLIAYHTAKHSEIACHSIDHMYQSIHFDLFSDPLVMRLLTG